MKSLKSSLLFLFCTSITVGVFITSDRAISQENPQKNAGQYPDVDLKYLTPEQQKEFWENFEKRLRKATGSSRVRSAVISGNRITTSIYDYASISRPGLATNDLVWNGLGYGYEFGPLVGAEITDADGKVVHIIDDGFILRADGDYDPSSDLKWGWLPQPGYADSAQDQLALFSDRFKIVNGKPKSWPGTWFNPVLGRYVWPSFLGDDATTPDEEAFFICDDFTNKEFRYYPFPDDSTKRGLGLELKCRIFQFNNPLAEDIIFLVYEVTNVSPKRLDKVYFGMFGDPHVGGANDFSDDYAGFITPFGEILTDQPPVFRPDIPFDARNMLFAFDLDGVGQGGRRTGYFGYKFLESPTNSHNGIDDDGDGIVDEDPFNDAGIFLTEPNAGPNGYLQGISDIAQYTRLYGPPHPRWQGDEDGDWDPKRDDVGADGIPGTGDFGEGNGRPDQGEPNFGFKDVAESDQIGLTSFNALLFGGDNRPKNDELMWQKMSTANMRPEIIADPAKRPTIEQKADNVFIYGSGPFPLGPGESQRFSIALLMGENLDDLILNAVTSQQIFRADYRFSQPPEKPTVVAVPGDKKVTLYWDTRAESSVDPLSGQKDFEGYKIYRSEDYTFTDVFTVTDANGIPFLGQPLTDTRGVKAQWDLVDEWQGLHPIEYPGRGIRYFLGNNTGLVHSYVDSTNVINGKTYYYAVVAYDRGDTGKVRVPPTETQHAIKRDPITGKFTFDVNTAGVVPGPPAGGFVKANLDNPKGDFADRTALTLGTGDVRVKILNDFFVKDNKQYEVPFAIDTSTRSMAYSLRDLSEITDSLVARDTVFSPVKGSNLVPGTVTLKTSSGAVVPSTNYVVDYEKGRIKGSRPGALPSGQNFVVTYQFFPFVRSPYLANEDANPVYDGLRVFVRQDPIALDTTRSGWKVNTGNNVRLQTALSDAGIVAPYPADFEIRFMAPDIARNDSTPTIGDLRYTSVDTSTNGVVTPFQIINTTEGNRREKFFISEPFNTRNRRWDLGEKVIIFTPNVPINQNRTVYQFTALPVADTLRVGGRDSLVDKSNPPKNGDIYLLFSKKPFVAGDKFTFKTKAAFVDEGIAKSALDKAYVVPNPYVIFNPGEQPDILTDRRGERRLYFRNLPQKCTIRIYTVTGELVNTIEKDDLTDYAIWNLLSNEAQALSYGIYLYHIDAPGIGQKIGRFAIIK